MYTKIDSIICSYLNTPDTDYAIFLNGEWGSGKTYYTKNHLIELNVSKKYQPIYISLNGIDNLQKIKDTIFYNHMKNEHKFNIDLQFVDQIIDIGKKVPKFGDLFDIGSKVASSTRNILFDKINLENYFLIFDDLERISPKLEIQEVLGYLFDNFIDRNIKCLIIGYENEIDCEDFDKIKEKIFRRMINFNPDSELLCRDFIDKKYIKSPIHDYLMKNINTLVWFIDEIKAKNLRTLDFFINTFEDIYKCADQLKDDLDILNSIFISTLILCIEYKDGKINYENLDDYKGLDFSSSYYFINKEKYDKQEEKPYSFLFIDKYVNQYKLEFKLLKSVFEYIITGYLDTIKLKNEIDEKYNIAKKPEWILALDKITDITNIEIEDLEHNITNVIKYLKLGKYHLSRLIYIYSVLSYIKRRIYDDKWDYEDIDGLIKIALEKSSENPDNIPTIIEISTFTHVYDETIRGLEIYEYMKSIIIEKSNSQKSKETNVLLKEILEQSCVDDDLFKKTYSNYHNNKFFEDLYKTENSKKLQELNNNGITWIEIIVSETILRISNAGEYHYSEKKYIEIICEELLEYIGNNELDKLRRFRYMELLEHLKKAIQHLENTKKAM